jgi:hypothetical protein
MADLECFWRKHPLVLEEHVQKVSKKLTAQIVRL